MISIKRALIFILAALIPFSAFAAVNGGASPAEMQTLVDQYVAELAKPSPDSQLAKEAKEEYLAKIVATQVSTLEPEDFNLFLIYLTDRYLKNPSERESLFQFTSALHDSIATDLANTKALEDGPYDEITHGALYTGTWILIAGVIGWRVLLASPARNALFIQRLQEQELVMAKAKPLYRLPYKIATNPLTLSAVAGASVAGIQYWLESNRTHRLDPIKILGIAQANLACHLSYKGLELQDQYDKISDNGTRLLAQYKDLSQNIADVESQSKVLLKESDQLDNLYVSDPYFQKDLKKLPPSKDFQAFRQELSDMEKAPEGRCHEMSLSNLNRALESLKENLDSSYSAVAPSQEAKP